MKIATNFVSPAQQAARPLQMLSWLAAGLLLVLCAWLVRDALDLRAGLPELRQRVARSASLVEASPVQALPAQRELNRTRERVARLNAVARTTGVQSSVLLSELETLLPPQAWLTRWHYRATEGTVSLVAAAPSAEPLSAFLLKLERSALFEQAMLMREVQPTGAGQGGVQFEIRLKVRP